MHVVICRTDGSVALMNVVNRDGLERALSEFKVMHPGTYVRHYEVNEWPEDTSFVDAWTHDLTVDMERAREVHRQRMREAREPILRWLDVKWMMEFGQGLEDMAKETEGVRQLLRDVTDDPAIDLAKSPDDLKAVWPEVLTGKTHK